MTVIVGIDPGYTTGVVATLEQADDFQVSHVWQILWESRLSFFQALFSGTFVTYNDKPLMPEIVVVESFRLRVEKAMQQVGSEFPSVRIIGIIEAFIHICSPVKPLLVFQDPPVIGRVEVLPEHKDILSGLIHAQAAYRHVRYYHVTTRSK